MQRRGEEAGQGEGKGVHSPRYARARVRPLAPVRPPWRAKEGSHSALVRIMDAMDVMTAVVCGLHDIDGISELQLL